MSQTALYCPYRVDLLGSVHGCLVALAILSSIGVIWRSWVSMNRRLFSKPGSGPLEADVDRVEHVGSVAGIGSADEPFATADGHSRTGGAQHLHTSLLN